MAANRERKKKQLFNDDEIILTRRLFTWSSKKWKNLCRIHTIKTMYGTRRVRGDPRLYNGILNLMSMEFNVWIFLSFFFSSFLRWWNFLIWNFFFFFFSINKLVFLEYIYRGINMLGVVHDGSVRNRMTRILLSIIVNVLSAWFCVIYGLCQHCQSNNSSVAHGIRFTILLSTPRHRGISLTHLNLISFVCFNNYVDIFHQHL